MYIIVNVHINKKAHMKFKNFKDLLEESLTAQQIAELELKAHQELRAARRFVIEVPDEYHRLVKIKAAEKNISIRAWISRAIKAELEKEKQYE